MALFKLTSDLVGFIPARLTLNINDVLPALLSVETEYIGEQVIGMPQYAQLHSAYQANTMTAAETALLAAVRPAIAHLMLYHSADSLSIQIQSGGFTVQRGEKNDVASMARIQAFKQEQLRFGYRALDRLVQFMFDHQNDYGLFVGNEAFGIVDGFVTNTRTFMRYVTTIGNSGYLFMRMRPVIRAIEDEEIRAVICDTDLYTAIMQECVNDTFTGYNQAIAQLVRPAICHLTMARSITELSLKMDNQGIWSLEMTGGSTAEGPATGPKSVDARRLDAVQAHHEKQGAHYLKLAKDKLQELAEAGNMPLYAASHCYNDPNDTSDDPPERDPESSVGDFT